MLLVLLLLPLLVLPLRLLPHLPVVVVLVVVVSVAKGKTSAQHNIHMLVHVVRVQLWGPANMMSYVLV